MELRGGADCVVKTVHDVPGVHVTVLTGRSCPEGSLHQDIQVAYLCEDRGILLPYRIQKLRKGTGWENPQTLPAHLHRWGTVGQQVHKAVSSRFVETEHPLHEGTETSLNGAEVLYCEVPPYPVETVGKHG